MNRKLVMCLIITGALSRMGLVNADNLSSTGVIEEVIKPQVVVANLSGEVMTGQLPERISGLQRAYVSGSMEGALINNVITYFYQHAGLKMIEDVFVENTGYNIYSALPFSFYSGCQWNYSSLNQPFISVLDAYNWEAQAQECVANRLADHPEPKQKPKPTYVKRTNKILSTWRYNSDINNRFGRGYCTWYAAIISPEIFNVANIRGNANERCASARSEGLNVTKEPSVGALIVYGRLTSYAGHVGKVIDYDYLEGQLIIKEMNYVGKYIANTRTEDVNNPSIKCYISLYN